MPHFYKVNKEPHLFIDARCKGDSKQIEGYISYRMVICNAIKYSIDQKSSKEDIKTFLKELDYIENTTLNQNNFFEIHPLIDEAGVVIIDKSKGCYPLVLYGDKADNKFFDETLRISAFKVAKDDILKNYEKIYNEINGSEFNEALHCKLEHIFNDYVPKKIS